MLAIIDEAELTLRSLLIDGELEALRRRRDSLKQALAATTPTRPDQIHPLAVAIVGE